DVPDAVKVVNLVKALHDAVSKDRATKPFLASIGEKAQSIADRYRKGQISTEQALKEAADLDEERKQAEVAQEVTGLPPEAFATLWFLQGKGVPAKAAEIIAASAADAFA